MSTTFSREILSRLDPNGAFACECGREHRLAARHVLLEEGALEASAELLARRHGRAALWVLSDENTEAAAGRRWKACIRAERVDSRVLPAEPRPVPTMELVEELTAEVRACAPRLLVAVGSGVVSDLVKKVSFDTGLPNWCIATASSVDAYASATAAIRVGGYHRSLRAAPAEVIVCDVDVLRCAPPLLFLAGLGDLVAKFVASLDWDLAAAVAGEQRCQAMSALALASARRALAAARERDPAAAARALGDAVVVSGFAMQAVGSSRPAASAEHVIAHYWEMAGAVERKEHDLHGLLVGGATRLVLRGYTAWYRALAAAPRDPAARLAAYRPEAPWRERLEETLRPFERHVAEEMRGRRFDRATLAARLAAFAREEARLVPRALSLLGELSTALDFLESVGFPATLDELGIARPQRAVPLRNVRILRDRYTTFDLAHELGSEEELVAAMAEP